MCHETQIRKIPESKTAVLLVHGILGTPHQFDPFLSAIPDSWSTVNLLLDGHGGSVQSFGRSSMQKWEKQVSSVTDALCRDFQNVFIIAHSMGTLFAIDEAIAHPEKIKGILLLSPPLKVHPRLRLIRYAYHIGLGFGSKSDAEIDAVRRAYSLQTDRRVWKYTRWIPRYLELFSKIKTTRLRLPFLKTPTTVFLCHNDEMVSLHSDRYVKEHPACTLFYLTDSTHFTYSEKGTEQIRQAVKDFQNRI